MYTNNSFEKHFCWDAPHLKCIKAVVPDATHTCEYELLLSQSLTVQQQGQNSIFLGLTSADEVSGALGFSTCHSLKRNVGVKNLSRTEVHFSSLTSSKFNFPSFECFNQPHNCYSFDFNATTHIS